MREVLGQFLRLVEVDLVVSLVAEVFLAPFLKHDHVGHDMLVLHAVFPVRSARPAHEHVRVAGILLPNEPPGD